MSLATAELSRRLRELRAQMDGERPPERHPHLITARQLAYLTDLLNRPNGLPRYRALKRAMGITAPLGRLSKREAWLIIHHFTRRDSR